MLAPVPVVKLDASLVLQNVNLDALPAQQFFVPLSIRDVPNNKTIELSHVKKRCTDITRAKRGIESCLAEIVSSSIPNCGSLPVIVGVIFLHEGIMPFPYDLPCLVVDYDCANGTAALIKTFLSKPEGDAHEVLIDQFCKEIGVYYRWNTARGDVSDRVEDVVIYFGVMVD